ncbi:MAG: polymerase gamma/tau subunit DnaX [Pseudomonadota bacterium]
MSDLVLARKYRPRSFEQMVGQEHVVQALGNALGSGRLHHAYLFTGTRGIGKTTVSRILAKSLNCTGPDGSGGVTAQPCGVCQACTEIDADRYIDYIEMDAASNGGKDEIRDLIERAAYKPSVGRYKVFMIDEAHQLSKDAFNALLKTLEEPPAYLKFVLATTDPEKVLPTVLSRCLQFNLKPMAPQTVHEHLQRVLEAEAIPTDAGALRLLARAARGSMRDALSLTDQAIAYGAGQLEEAGVRTMLGTVDRSHAATLVQALARRDGPALLATVDALRSAGLSAAGTLEEMARLLQQMAVEQAVPDALDAQDPDTASARQLAAELPPDETQLLYSIVIHGRAELSLVSDDHAALTMVLLRMLAFPSQRSGEATAPPAAPVPARAAPLVASPALARAEVPVPPVVPLPSLAPSVRGGAAPEAGQPPSHPTPPADPVHARALPAREPSPLAAEGPDPQADPVHPPSRSAPQADPSRAAMAARSPSPAVGEAVPAEARAPGHRADAEPPAPDAGHGHLAVSTATVDTRGTAVPGYRGPRVPLTATRPAGAPSPAPVPGRRSVDTPVTPAPRPVPVAAVKPARVEDDGLPPWLDDELPAAAYDGQDAALEDDTDARPASPRAAGVRRAPAGARSDAVPAAAPRAPLRTERRHDEPARSAAPAAARPVPDDAGAPRASAVERDASIGDELAEGAPSVGGVRGVAAAQPAWEPTPLGERWSALLRPVLATGSLVALARELAVQAELTAVRARDDGAPGQIWTLRVERESLRSSAALRDKLCTVLGEACGEPVELELLAGVAQDSIARRDAAARAAAQRAAEACVQADEVVRVLRQTFRGARVVPGSIQPEAPGPASAG